MATPGENFQLLTDYYAAYGAGGPEGIARMARFYAKDKPAYIAGNSELSGNINNTEEAVKYLLRLQELNGGNIKLVGSPTLLVVGDTMVAALINEQHTRPGKPPLIVPRLCVYEIANGKLSRAFVWQLESQAFDDYYPRS
ncbi:MAG TPA: hypothetical protein VGE08_07910 [Steroidobacter sp.]|uniref:hypothetical protein n=1 Tax=Steroidobacter sp. TaxID=1978227 RepID=UPI002ED7E955